MAYARFMPDYSYESAHGGLVAGVDEVGRGPLAGPVLAAALVFLAPPDPALADLLDDSKKLKAAKRDLAAAALRGAAREGRLCFAVAAASATEIGRLNILQATYLAMRRALARLPVTPDLVLVDGNRAPPLTYKTQCLVGGDALSLSIAGASILAKTVRDRAMARLDPRWPVYGFGKHAGYPTLSHREAIVAHGVSPHHRRGFAPVDAALGLMSLMEPRLRAD